MILILQRFVILARL